MTICSFAGQTLSELLCTWKRVLQRFQDKDLRLSAKKTVICPRSTTVLGWLWSQGTIAPSPHKINPLVCAEPPITVKGLRSWLGAAKYLKTCVKDFSSALSPLEAVIGKTESRDHIKWTEDLLQAFRHAQYCLADARTITVPRLSDQLVITTDVAIRNNGVGALLHILREGKTLLGGYFSMKLRTYHVKWLPCEGEALAIASAVEYWSIDIQGSDQDTQILTDSRPCVQAFAKLRRGRFSSSARVATFLSTLSRHKVTLQHISGKDNETADYLSRNPAVCYERHCQICDFAI